MNINAPASSLPDNKSQFQGTPTDESKDIDLRAILRVLWRRKDIIAATVFILTLLSVIVLFQLTPRYAASARVLLDSRDREIVNIDPAVTGGPGVNEAITSEIEIIQSQKLAEKVIRKLGLSEDPEFNSELRPESLTGSLRSALDDMVQFFKGEDDAQPTPLELQFDEERVAIIDSFLDKLTVSRLGESRVVTIRFESTKPETAVLVANTTAELYLDEQLEARFEATQRVTAWLSERLRNLREQVEQSESAVEAYKREAGLIQGTNLNLTEQQISELNTQLIIAQGERAEAEARLRQVTTLVGSSDNVETAAEVLASPLIQSLRREEATIERRLAELSNEYGDKHPRMISARAEMADLRGKINDEVNKIVQNLRNEVSVARAREATLRQSLKDLDLRMADLNENEIELRALQREADANRQLYETFLTRFKETSSQEDVPNSASRIISPAELPSAPSFPNKPLTLLLVITGSLFLGVALAFAAEQLTPGFISLEQVELSIGIPALGLIPVIGKGKGRPEDFVIKNPLSEISEAIRTVYTALTLSHAGRSPKVILVTSAFPKEGKTTVAVLLGRVLSLLGKRVLIIDADLRRAEVHGRLNLNASPGLVELLAREASMSEVVQRDEATGLCVVSTGRPSSNASELLHSERLQDVLDRTAADYDLVIIDSPPTMAVADARMLSHHADVTIFVARWAVTRREVVAMAIRNIREAGGNIGGIVLSRVNVRRHSAYGYGDSGAYYGQLQKYYKKS